MNMGAQSLWLRTLVTLAQVSLFLMLFHTADDFVRGEATQDQEVLFGLVTLVVGVPYAFALLWTWSQRVYGYWILLVANVLIFYGAFLSHTTRLGGAHGFAEMAAQAGAWGPVMVTASFLSGVTTVTVVILAAYFIYNRRAATA